VGGANCITHAVLHVEAGKPARFGFIVSKAVGNAVTRNLVRRRLKSIVEQRLSDGFTGADVVFRMMPRSADTSFQDLKDETNRALDRIERLRAESQ
jgi:ribonuclease P protein component